MEEKNLDTFLTFLFLKEKKHIGDNAAKSSEDLAVAEEKVNHLSQIKKKLESTLDELESSLEKEKRARTTVEKDRSTSKGKCYVHIFM